MKNKSVDMITKNYSNNFQKIMIQRLEMNNAQIITNAKNNLLTKVAADKREREREAE